MEPFEKEIESLFDSEEYYYETEALDNNPIFDFDGRATADVGITAGLVFGIIAFVGGWAGNKILDELYEIKMRPAIVNFFNQVNKVSTAELK